MDKGPECFKEAAIDPETIALLCAAYDKACKSLHDTGQPTLVNEIIAQRIIALAKQGERDPDKLCGGALNWAIRPRAV
jgi:hypothetical protein